MAVIKDNFTEIGKAILKTLLYFDVFKYPLTKKEIWETCAVSINQERQLDGELKKLEKSNFLFKIGEYYAVDNDIELANRRKKGNQRAEKLIKKARFLNKIISKFPFVRGVFISGSLSKNYADENSDIDFFIITESNRLWITRSLFFLFKKIILLNSSKYFCFNYMVDLSKLYIKEQTYYTAIEIVTLIPLSGGKYYNLFMETNKWTKSYFPNYPSRLTKRVPVFNKNPITSGFEFLNNIFFADRFNRYLMKLTIKWWNYKLGQINWDERFYFANSPNHSKEHSHNHYPRISETYNKKIQSYQDKFNIDLNQIPL